MNYMLVSLWSCNCTQIVHKSHGCCCKSMLAGVVFHTLPRQLVYHSPDHCYTKGSPTYHFKSAEDLDFQLNWNKSSLTPLNAFLNKGCPIYAGSGQFFLLDNKVLHWWLFSVIVASNWPTACRDYWPSGHPQ